MCIFWLDDLGIGAGAEPTLPTIFIERSDREGTNVAPILVEDFQLEFELSDSFVRYRLINNGLHQISVFGHVVRLENWRCE